MRFVQPRDARRGRGGAQSQTGFRLEAVTVRKLEFENDAFAFGDKLVEKWYETVEQGGKKGVLVVVSTGNDGALTGGTVLIKGRPGGQGSPRRQACLSPRTSISCSSHR